VDEAQSQPRFGARGCTSVLWRTACAVPGLRRWVKSHVDPWLVKSTRGASGWVPRGVSGRARGLLQPRTGNEQKSRNARLPLILFFDSGPTFQKGAHGAVPNRGLPSVSPDRW
jgi:hypothetical protein